MNAILKPTMHPDERKARVELAACYRVFAMLGWTEMIYNHITVRLPDSVTGGQKQFLINPFGLHYSEVKASNLLKIDLAGGKLDDNPWRVNPAGMCWTISTGTGRSPGSIGMTSASAFGPPVDTPMTTRSMWWSPVWRTTGSGVG